MKLVFLYLLAVANLICVLHIGLYTIGANFYDVKKFKQARDKINKNLTKNTKKIPKPALVSVIIPAHNEAKVIRRTLDSVLVSNYSKIEIIVVNDGSSDRTKEIVKDYIKRVRTRSKLRIKSPFNQDGLLFADKIHWVWVFRRYCRIRIITQANEGKAAAMNNAIKNYAKGQFIMCLDADSILHPQAIKRAVEYFKDNHVIGVAANVRIIESKSILGKVQRFEHLIGYRSKKFFTLTNSEFIVGGVASTYRRTALKRVKFYDNDTMTEDIGLSIKLIAKNGNKSRRIIYASDVVALTEGVHTFQDLLKQRYRWKMGNLQNLFKYRSLIGRYDPKNYSRMLTMYRLPMALVSELLLLLEPILLGYVIYLSISYHTIGIAIGAYMTITFYVMNALWPDEHLSLSDKIKMSLSAVWIYGVFYIMDVVQISAILKSLRLYKNILNTNMSLNTWISPKRAKQTSPA
ncbi:MAG TPA: glycosyltransferase [Candidatus Saccharimonadia bacterium]|nr:glycosyltransferase [Candidatus Saccharimonadia bacterium]